MGRSPIQEVQSNGIVWRQEHSPLSGEGSPDPALDPARKPGQGVDVRLDLVWIDRLG